MMNISKALVKDKILGTFVILAILAASFFFFIRPTLSQDDELVKKTQANQQQLLQLQSQEQSFKAQEQTIGQQQAQAEELSQKFPPTADAAAITALVQEVGAASGVSVRTVNVSSPAPLSNQNPNQPSPTGGGNPNPEVNADPNTTQQAPPTGQAGSGTITVGGQDIYQINIDITLSGSPTSVGLFVQNLETAPRTIYTKAVTSSSNTSTSQSSEQEGSQQVNAFTFLLPPLQLEPPPIAQ